MTRFAPCIDDRRETDFHDVIGPFAAKGLTADVEHAEVGEPATAAVDPIGRHAPVGLPCQVHDPELWFADNPADLERAKALCAACPARSACLTGAIRRQEPAGVWGGQIFQGGRVIPFKRPKGRPPKNGRIPGSMPAHAACWTLHRPKPTAPDPARTLCTRSTAHDTAT